MALTTWLHSWIEAEEIHNADQLDRSIKDQGSWNKLVELAETDRDKPPEVEPLRRGLTAGRSLDLTQFLACGHVACLTKQVDVLFSHVWHYFDTIAVVGPDTHELFDFLREGKPAAAQRVASMGRVLFHIRDIGAEELFTFVPKPPACPIHWPEVFDMDSFRLSDSDADQLERDLSERLRIEPINDRSGRGWLLRHRLFANGSHFVSEAGMKEYQLPSMPLKDQLIKSSILDYWLGAASDLSVSEEIGLPIGTTLPLEARLISALRPAKTTAEEIAFNLKLPYVANIKPVDLIRIREDESDAFAAFRSALKQAINEHLRTDSSGDPALIAKEVVEDLVDPALIEIRRKLAVAERSVNRRNRMSQGVAALATVCGIIGSKDPAVALTAGAIASGVTNQYGFVSDQADAELSNMYFLWKVHVHQESGTKRHRHR